MLLLVEDDIERYPSDDVIQLMMILSIIPLMM